MPGLSIACTGLGKVDHYEAEIENDGRRLLEGLLFLALYCALIPLADYLSMHAGFACEPEGPCTFPVGFGLQATTGALPIGAAFVLRDYVQCRFGLAASASTVVMGAALAGFLASPMLVVASALAMLVAGFADLLVYTALARRDFVAAVIASSLLSSLIDSAVFLWVAFSSLELLAGQTLGKAWVVLLAYPVTRWLWKRDQRIGLAGV
jgi:uncharacterized PurR-regulated membrane protein YhhQ (DUF165 family)